MPLLKKIFPLFLFSFLSISIYPQEQRTISGQGVSAPVEIRIDRWGIAHIYAQTESDLFFAQGYNAARDRLFQFEIWQRQATGTVAELLGPRELNRDIGTRLFKFRGHLEEELTYYHPRGTAIIKAFVAGVNAYIEETRRHPELLPIEFELLDTQPQKWTPEVVISRHQGLLGNINRELEIARMVHLTGPDNMRKISNFHPGQPALSLDPAINRESLFDGILDLYNAFRRPVRFQPEDITTAYQGDDSTYQYLARLIERDHEEMFENELNDIGSNNWILAGEHTQSGFPIMANDPHRTQAVPSLRYAVHLVGPGWNVIGGGEPEIPGVSIGHNESGAWGLTVFRTDAEDLYVYETQPHHPDYYRYKNQWVPMQIISDTIPVKGQKPVIVSHKFTRHGPVVFEDTVRHIAYAVRAGWMEIGGAPYLASLRMDQAHTWEEFREACNYSHIPGENMIWADRTGNIGWQAVGIAPVRPNWDGLLPVPGDGRYEWAGFLPIKAKPHVINPAKGFFSTANQHITPPDYPHRNAIAWEWAAPYRGNRLIEVLSSGRKHTMMDMMQLQTDYLSIPARNLVPLLKEVKINDPGIEEVRHQLLKWDYVLDKQSVTAGIYVAWEKRVVAYISNLVIPKEVKPYYSSLSLKQVLDMLMIPHPALGEDPLAGREQLLVNSLRDAISDLEAKLGKNRSAWQYGQPNYKHILIRHPLSPAVKPEIRQKLEVGPHPRGGYGHTVGSTSGRDNQSSGASFRIIVDTGDWDHTVGMNSPGQSGDPANPHYQDLFLPWARDQFIPFAFSRQRVEALTETIIVITP